MADERDELDEVMDRAYNGEYALGLLMVKARSIRARERKLAELAHALIEDRRRLIGWEPDDLDRRYDEAVK